MWRDIEAEMIDAEIEIDVTWCNQIDMYIILHHLWLILQWFMLVSGQTRLGPPNHCPQRTETSTITEEGNAILTWLACTKTILCIYIYVYMFFFICIDIFIYYIHTYIYVYNMFAHMNIQSMFPWNSCSWSSWPPGEGPVAPGKSCCGHQQLWHVWLPGRNSPSGWHEDTG